MFWLTQRVAHVCFQRSVLSSLVFRGFHENDAARGDQRGGHAQSARRRFSFPGSWAYRLDVLHISRNVPSIRVHHNYGKRAWSTRADSVRSTSGEERRYHFGHFGSLFERLVYTLETRKALFSEPTELTGRRTQSPAGLAWVTDRAWTRESSGYGIVMTNMVETLSSGEVEYHDPAFPNSLVYLLEMAELLYPARHQEKNVHGRIEPVDMRHGRYCLDG